MASRYPKSGRRNWRSLESNWRWREDLTPSGRSNLSNIVSSHASDSPVIRGRGRILRRPTYSVRNLAPDRPISWADLLKKLQTADLPEVISRLNDTGNGLARLLDGKLNKHVLQLLVCLLSRICNGDQMSTETTNIVTVLHEKRFLESSITPWLGEWTAQNPPKDVLETNLEAIVSILIKLLQEIPDSVSSIGTVLLIMRKIVREREDNNNTISFNLSAKIKAFMEEHEKYQRDSHEMALCTRKISRRQPPDNFRYLPILPMTHELRSTHKPFLRAIIVKGKYTNVHHYLDVHFRLLREDFMQPLRDGIAEYFALLPRHRFGQKMPLQNISLYERVSVKPLKLSQEGLIYTVNFEEDTTLKHVDWETCKRLLPGSLVCLSPDDFQTLICGIIKNRDLDKLALGVIEVIISHERLPSYAIFKMVEPQSYFESYRHVLSSLQTMNEDTFPLQQYLVSGLTKPYLPKYIADNPQMPGFRIYADFEKGLNNRRIINCRRVKVGDDTGWPTASQLGLDSSQMEAFQAALREEVCVIQGPPGTGKTLLGLKIVETLLINKTKWSMEKPLLVVCYTNHALDQFLNGILKFDRNVIRLGKRSNSETVQKYNIDVVLNRDTLNNIRNVNSCRDREYYPTLEKYKDILNMARHKLLNISSLALVTSVAHHYSLRYSSFHQQKNCLLDWLFDSETRKHFMSEENKETKTVPNIICEARGNENGDDGEAKCKYGEEENEDYVVDDDNNNGGDASEGFKGKSRILGEDDGHENDETKEEEENEERKQQDLQEGEGGGGEGEGEEEVEREDQDQEVGDESEDDDDEEIDEDNICEKDEEGKEYEEVRKDNGDDKGPNVNAFLKTVFPQSKVQNVFKLTFSEHLEVNDVFISEEELTDYYDCHYVTRHQTTLKQLIRKKLLQNDAISMEQAEMVTDVWSLDLDQRWRLYKLWQNMFIEKMQKKLECLSENITERENNTKEIHEIAIRRAFRRFSVIGATTTGAAKNSALLQILGPPIVVVEEAAEILEAHIITALSSNCQHLILIGDHQQLRPSVEVYKLCKDYKLDVSLFERLVMNGMPCHRLVTQHRMRPEISHLLKIHKDFYPDLKDHDTVAEYEDVWGLDKNLYFIDHSYTEDHSGNAKSRSNHHEATFLYALFRYLLKQGYSSSQITILTAYRGQVRTFSQIMEGKHFREARVCPIDNFQGEENDIILFSFVRSNEEGNIGFLKVSNRICVAFSRARIGLYCIGNFTLMSKQNPLWKAIINDLHTRKCIGPHLKLVCRNHSETFTEVSVAEDFRRVPEGGCSEPCNARLNCGHTCQKACHPEDKEHRKVSCKKPCENVMCEQRHICPLICGADCGPKCTTMIEHILPCLHKQRAQCYLKPEDISCKVDCKEVLPCGHRCQEKCSKPCTTRCEQITTKYLLCGHEQAVKCFLNPEKEQCKTKCDKILPCGHGCAETCSRECTELCKVIVQKDLPCGHMQYSECYRDAAHIMCTSRCGRLLPCGHFCKEKCWQKCTSKCVEIVTNTLKCGHVGVNECYCQQECQALVTKMFRSCGHLATVECYKSSKCPKPCEKRLICGHICSGSCGECQNGRRHVKCKRPCEKYCLHHRCKNVCGDICDQCSQQCLCRCQHSRCRKPCRDQCDRTPCNKPCRKRLQCRHRCTGLCGEPCPPFCRICNRTCITWLLGGNYKPRTRFILLLDCNHVVDVKTMDKLMKNFAFTNGLLPECPLCRTQIRYNPRYQNKLRIIWQRLRLAKKQRRHQEAQRGLQLSSPVP